MMKRNEALENRRIEVRNSLEKLINNSRVQISSIEISDVINNITKEFFNAIERWLYDKNSRGNCQIEKYKKVHKEILAFDLIARVNGGEGAFVKDLDVLKSRLARVINSR